MDIALIDSINFNSTNNIPQLGLVSLYQILSKSYSVEIVDFDYMNYSGEFNYTNNLDEDIDHIVDYLIGLNAKVYSFYTISNSYPVTLLIARKIKEKLNSVKIILGGPQATLTAKDSMESFPFIDSIGMGEGELYIEEFMEALITNKDLDSIKGVVHRRGDEIIANERPRLLTSQELSEISYLNYTGKSLYQSESEVIAIEGGRGCPFSCTFCSTSLFWKNNFRLRDIDVLVNEIEQLNVNFGTRHIDLMHDHFTVNKEHLELFCKKMIDRNLPITWGCSSRIDNLAFESIELLKKSKCRSIFVGIETGSQRLQKIIKKNINLDKAFEKILYITKMGIDVTVSFVYGFKEETIEDFKDTLYLMDKLYTNGVEKVQLHKLMPLPMTKELEYVADIMYFDKNDIDLSIHNEGIMSDEIYSMIKSYPKVFSQFYTFESEVRRKYRRIDTLVNFLTSINRVAKGTFGYLIKNYGVDKLYCLFSKEIEDAYNEMNSSSIVDFFDYKDVPEIFKRLYRLVIDRISNEDNIFFKNIAEFEYMVITQSFNEDSIYHFEVDVLKARKVIIDEKVMDDCYIIFSKNKENDKIKISKVSKENVEKLTSAS